jgi:hypothetical protein
MGARDALVMKGFWATCIVVGAVWAKQWWTLARKPSAENY